MFPPVEVVADDYLVAVPFEGLTGFGYEKVGVSFQLKERRKLVWRSYAEYKGEGLTLKETMYPPGVHSSTKGFRIFGTWSISMCKLPLPDWILCSD